MLICAVCLISGTAVAQDEDTNRGALHVDIAWARCTYDAAARLDDHVSPAGDIAQALTGSCPNETAAMEAAIEAEADVKNAKLYPMMDAEALVAYRREVRAQEEKLEHSGRVAQVLNERADRPERENDQRPAHDQQR
jgi:hypothetical protein